MKAIATQALTFLILIATFVTLSIPSLIEEIKTNRTTTTTSWITTITTPLEGKYCRVDSDCIFLPRKSCCPGPPDPCQRTSPLVGNLIEKQEILRWIEGSCDEEARSKCPLYSPPLCSGCYNLEDYTPVCVSNKCIVRTQINCKQYCLALRHQLELKMNWSGDLCPWVSHPDLITPENTEKCSCEDVTAFPTEYSCNSDSDCVLKDHPYCCGERLEYYKWCYQKNVEPEVISCKGVGSCPGIAPAKSCVCQNGRCTVIF